jgi:hypothetical protein
MAPEGCLAQGAPLGVVTLDAGEARGPVEQLIYPGPTCFRADYAGDYWHLPASFANADAACHQLPDPCATPGAHVGAAAARLGDAVYVGAPGAEGGDGAVCVFGAQGEHRGVLPGHARERYGAAIAASADRLYVGAPGAGRVDVYGLGADGLVLETSLASGAPGDEYGAALAVEGDLLVVGAPGTASRAGAVHLLQSGGGVRVDNPFPAAGDAFGASVAASASRVVVGAPGDSALAEQSGMAYAFTRQGGFVRALAPPHPTAQGAFGASVAAEATTAFVGEPGGAAAYIMDVERGTVTRAFAPPSPAPLSRFGESVVHANGVLAVGAPGLDAEGADAGAAYVFHDASGALLRAVRPLAAAPGAGARMALAGEDLVVGAPDSDASAPEGGAAELYEGVFAPRTPVPAEGKGFGEALAPAAEGGVYVSAPLDNRVARVARSGVRTLLPAPADAGGFGWALASLDGLLAVGAPGNLTVGESNVTGQVLLFRGDALEATLAPPVSTFGDAFGRALALGPGVLLVGAPGHDEGATNAGAAYVRLGTEGGLRSIANPEPGINHRFGAAVAVSPDGRILAVAAPGDACRPCEGSASNAGAVYLFDAGTRALLGVLHAPEPGPNEEFGAALAFASPGTLLVGAPGAHVGPRSAGAVFVVDVASRSVDRVLLAPSPAGGERFGASLGVAGIEVLIGAPGSSQTGIAGGGAYLFDWTGGGAARVLPGFEDGKPSALGRSVLLHGGVAYVGAPAMDGGGLLTVTAAPARPRGVW